MGRTIIIFIFLSCFGSAVFATPLRRTAANEFYVASNGDDTNPGTRERPFGSLEKARDVIRQLKEQAGLPPGDVTIYIRAGKYFRQKSFELTGEDAGSENHPVVYRNYPNEDVRIIGGRQIEPSWFSAVTASSAVWNRLDSSAQGKCLKVNLRQHGISDFGEPLAVELSFNGEIMQVARWPNEGFVRTTSAKDDITFGYDDPRPQRWQEAEDAWAMGYWKWGWASEICKIARIDIARKEITLTEKPGYGIMPGTPYYVLNLLEEIDSPGEWYLDRENGILYFWPPADISGSEILISLLTEPIIRLSETSHISLQGLKVEMGCGDGIDIIGGTDNLICRCVIRNLRTAGVCLSGVRNGIKDSEINSVGTAGILVWGGNRYQLINCENFIRNCHISDFGRWQRTYAPAIRLDGVGCIVANNLIHDAPHSAVLFDGNEHLIELNEIHNVCYEVDDAGAIYAGRDWGLRGNIIRYNFVHDIKSSLSGENSVHAIYLDDCASGILVFGNVLYKISGRAIMCGGGRDNTIENNVIAKCGSAHYTDRRGKVWIDAPYLDESWHLLEKIEHYHYKEPPWSEKYPRLAKILDNGLEQAKEPEGCVIIRNIGWQNNVWLEEGCLGACGGFSFYQISGNIENENPLFVDEKNMNLALREDSPAYTLSGFERIPFEKIGFTEINVADLNNDVVVDMRDMSVFADVWLAEERALVADMNVDSLINFLDFTFLAENWLWRR
jgi:hypothetical protein